MKSSKDHAKNKKEESKKMQNNIQQKALPLCMIKNIKPLKLNSRRTRENRNSERIFKDIKNNGPKIITYDLSERVLDSKK